MKVLSIDGGGIRGLIPALVLAEIERRTGRPTADLFDLIAGTSTGGVLACGLTRPGPDGRPLHSAEELAELYRSEGPKVFALRIEARYDDSGLTTALAASLGDARLKDALTDVLLTAYDVKDRFAFFFRSSRARTDDAYDFPLAAAARAAAAAPASFAPVEVTDAAGARSYWLRDGGAFASNPAMCAYAEVVGASADVSVIAALGTGAPTGAPQHDPVGFQAATLSRGRYRRLQAELRYASDAPDDAGEANLRRLEGDAERLIAERSQDIEALCEEVAG